MFIQWKQTPIIDCIIHLLLMTLHSERLPYWTLSYFVYECIDTFSKSYFHFINHLWKQFHVFKKCKKHFKTLLRQTVTNARLSFVFTRTWNRPCASRICIGVIIDLSIKTQSLCDVLIGRELNEIMPTAIGRLDIL